MKITTHSVKNKFQKKKKRHKRRCTLIDHLDLKDKWPQQERKPRITWQPKTPGSGNSRTHRTRTRNLRLPSAQPTGPSSPGPTEPTTCQALADQKPTPALSPFRPGPSVHLSAARALGSSRPEHEIPVRRTGLR